MRFRYEPFYHHEPPFKYESPAATKGDSMAKITKAVAQYKDMAASRKCGACDMFVRPHGCSLVTGTISASGTCKYFELAKKKS